MKMYETDWARQIKWLEDVQYAAAGKTVLVMGNLNTHSMASLYQVYPPEEASRVASRLEIHYTPRHGNWLDIAEIELSAMGRQCLAGRRIADLDELQALLKPWCQDRNTRQKKRGLAILGTGCKKCLEASLSCHQLLDVTDY